MDSQTTEKVLVTLTPVQLKDIYEKAAAIGAKEALKAFEQERKKNLAAEATVGLEIRSCSCETIIC